MAGLFEPLELPCGVVLKNRIAKSAMSDSLGDGRGQPTETQVRLYERWAAGGLAVSLVGEVQGSPHYAEKPGNLVLDARADMGAFGRLAQAGAPLWAQLGHAGAMAHAPISAPKGPSAIEVPGLRCEALSLAEIAGLPDEFAQTARRARDLGFAGVEVHAAHGFLLSQFLSPLFNQRRDGYGGELAARMRILLEVIEAVRGAVGPGFPVAVKLNATDQLEGGFDEAESLGVVAALDGTSIDLLDISGGTYFPGAKSASDSAGIGPYFLEFARRARAVTGKPLMVTGGFKTRAQADAALAEGTADIVGLARALVIEPNLPTLWQAGQMAEVPFPRFVDPPEGGITAWYTMRLSEIGEDRETDIVGPLQDAVRAYDARDSARAEVWRQHFFG